MAISAAVAHNRLVNAQAEAVQRLEALKPQARRASQDIAAWQKRSSHPANRHLDLKPHLAPVRIMDEIFNLETDLMTARQSQQRHTVALTSELIGASRFIRDFNMKGSQLKIQKVDASGVWSVVNPEDILQDLHNQSNRMEALDNTEDLKRMAQLSQRNIVTDVNNTYTLGGENLQELRKSKIRVRLNLGNLKINAHYPYMGSFHGIYLDRFKEAEKNIKLYSQEMATKLKAHRYYTHLLDAHTSYATLCQNIMSTETLTQVLQNKLRTNRVFKWVGAVLAVGGALGLGVRPLTK
jgi:hypothetical protein